MQDILLVYRVLILNIFLPLLVQQVNHFIPRRKHQKVNDFDMRPYFLNANLT